MYLYKLISFRNTWIKVPPRKNTKSYDNKNKLLKRKIMFQEIELNSIFIFL